MHFEHSDRDRALSNRWPSEQRDSFTRPVNFNVEQPTHLPHNGNMAENHQFTVRVEPDTSRPGRFRWALLKATQVYNRSEMSFATKREAIAEAAKVLDKRIAAWQALR
jgi:hypothetical protein